MNIYIIDLTDRNPVQYNPRLCSAMAKENIGGSVTLMSPKFDYVMEGYKTKKLLSFLPKEMSSSKGWYKRFVRAIETLANYIYLLFFFLGKKNAVVHFQWLPFLEFMSIESGLLWIFKSINPSVKLFLTIHNVFPHDISVDRRYIYMNRFSECAKRFDGFFVHLKSVKEEVANVFGVDERKVHIAYHGIFEADGYISKEKTNKSLKKKVLMYGYQNYYKGTDLMIEALKGLPRKYKDTISLKIVGKTDPVLIEKYKHIIETGEILWENRYVSNSELYDAINDADLLMFPYRNISQSGALLLALSYKKPIITSDLPSFVETLEGFPSSCFFKNGDVESLRALLVRYVNDEIDIKSEIDIIKKLNNKYSWDETAKMTLKAYSLCF